jgi:hypothetical protein
VGVGETLQSPWRDEKLRFGILAAGASAVAVGLGIMIVGECVLEGIIPAGYMAIFWVWPVTQLFFWAAVAVGVIFLGPALPRAEGASRWRWMACAVVAWGATFIAAFGLWDVAAGLGTIAVTPPTAVSEGLGMLHAWVEPFVMLLFLILGGGMLARMAWRLGYRRWGMVVVLAHGPLAVRTCIQVVARVLESVFGVMDWMGPTGSRWLGYLFQGGVAVLLTVWGSVAVAAWMAGWLAVERSHET